MPWPWIPPRGKPEKKAVFSSHCGDETTTNFNRAFEFQVIEIRLPLRERMPRFAGRWPFGRKNVVTIPIDVETRNGVFVRRSGNLLPSGAVPCLILLPRKSFRPTRMKKSVKPGKSSTAIFPACSPTTSPGRLPSSPFGDGRDQGVRQGSRLSGDGSLHPAEGHRFRQSGDGDPQVRAGNGRHPLL